MSTTKCPVHDISDCSPLLNGCSRLIAPPPTEDDGEEYGPDLVISQGDEEFSATCGGCHKHLLYLRPNQSFDLFAEVWDRHVNREGCRR